MLRAQKSVPRFMPAEELAVGQVGGKSVVFLLRALAVHALEHLADRPFIAHKVGLVLADEGVVAIILMAAGREHHELAAQGRHLDH